MRGRAGGLNPARTQERAGERVTVANGLFFACLGGRWLTYVLQPVASGWQVVGTTGPVAVS